MTELYSLSSHAGRRPYECERDAVPRQRNSPAFAGLFLHMGFNVEERFCRV